MGKTRTKDFQAKMISDWAFLSVVDRIAKEKGGGWVLAWEVEECFPGIPAKVVAAKGRKLIRRGLLDGCPCMQCRADYEIPSMYPTITPDLLISDTDNPNHPAFKFRAPVDIPAQTKWYMNVKGILSKPGITIWKPPPRGVDPGDIVFRKKEN